MCGRQHIVAHGHTIIQRQLLGSLQQSAIDEGGGRRQTAVDDGGGRYHKVHMRESAKGNMYRLQGVASSNR